MNGGRSTLPAHKRATIALLAAMLLVHNAQRMGVVTLFDPLKARYATDYGGVGTLFSAYVFGYGLFQSVIGVVGDRLNARRLLLGGLVLTTLFSTIFAETHSYDLALIARFLLGASGALLYTPAMKLGITLFARAERGRVLGVLQAGAGIGSSGAMIVVPAVVAAAGLTGGFLSLPMLTAVILLLAFFILPDAPVVSSAAGTQSESKLVRKLDFWELLTISLVGMLATYGLLTWLPTYLTNHFGYSDVRAGTLSSLANIALMVAAPLTGIAADLPHGRTGVVVSGSALAVIAFGLLIMTESIVPVLAITVLIGISMAATTSPLMLFAGERFDASRTARVIGWMATSAQLGATLAGVVFGVILSRHGSFQLIWLICGLLALLRLVAMLNLLRRDRVLRARRPHVSRASQ